MKYEEDLTSRENLLLESEPSEGVGGKEAKKLRERFFKCYVIAFAIFVWTGYTLLVAYTRQMTPKSELYSSSTVVFFSECIKLVISVFFVYRECEFSLKKGNQVPCTSNKNTSIFKIHLILATKKRILLKADRVCQDECAISNLCTPK